MRVRLFVVAIVAVFPVAALAAQGQARGRGQSDGRLRAMDTNRDGVITQSEWRGSAQAFRDRDRNGDRRLSASELRPSAARSGEQNADDFPPSDQEFDDWTAEGFDYLDSNHDGRLTRAEWFYDRPSFVRADRNRDGVLSRGEFIGDDDPDRPGGGPDRFDSLDRNHDGRVTQGEWDDDRASFVRVDRNRDNVVTRAELLAVESPRDERSEAGQTAQSAELFGNADGNRDGRLAESEWPWSRRSFAQQDANRDGFVTRREFSVPEGATRSGTTGPARPVPVVINVLATERWTDTGLDLRDGDVLRIASTGTVRLSAGADDSATAGGANRRAANALLPNHPAGALIGRIGNGAPFFIGDGTNIDRVQDAGRLYLGVNDDHLPDNSGSLRVTVTVRDR